MLKEIKIVLDDKAIKATRAHDTDAGLDLYTPHDAVIFPNDYCKIDTLCRFDIPAGYVGYVKSKSGLMGQGILTDGTVDAGYTGTVSVVLFNHSGVRKYFKAGEKIAQLVIQPVETPKLKVVDKLADTERGEGGFGSTGK